MKGIIVLTLFVFTLCAKTKVEYTAGVQKSTNLNYFDSIAGDGAESDSINILLQYRTDVL